MLFIAPCNSSDPIFTVSSVSESIFYAVFDRTRCKSLHFIAVLHFVVFSSLVFRRQHQCIRTTSTGAKKRRRMAARPRRPLLRYDLRPSPASSNARLSLSSMSSCASSVAERPAVSTQYLSTREQNHSVCFFNVQRSFFLCKSLIILSFLHILNRLRRCQARLIRRSIQVKTAHLLECTRFVTSHIHNRVTNAHHFASNRSLSVPLPPYQHHALRPCERVSRDASVPAVS